MQFVRAPDENVYIPPFNLIEMVVAVLLEWWMDKKTYERVNDWIMGLIYSPLLVVAAYSETRTAADIKQNRLRGDEDDDTIEEWEQMQDQVDFEREGWAKKVQSVRSNVEEEPCVLEVRKLAAEVEELKKLLLDISKAVVNGDAAEGNGNAKGKGKKARKGKKVESAAPDAAAEGAGTSSSSESD